MLRSEREREKRRKRMQAARQWAKEQCGDDPETTDDNSPIANVHEHGIRSIDRVCDDELDDGVILCGRVSDGRSDLELHLESCRAELRRRGIKLRRPTYGDVVPGQGDTLDPLKRPDLYRALAEARRLKARGRNVPVVFGGTSRALRNRDYHPYWNKQARPTEAELNAFLEVAEGVTILTINDPDASPAQDESFLRELRAKVKRRKVGRPRKKAPGYTKERMAKYLQPVLEKWDGGNGWSYRQLAEWVTEQSGHRITWTGIRKWCLRYGKAAAA